MENKSKPIHILLNSLKLYLQEMHHWKTEVLQHDFQLSLLISK